MEMIVLIFLVRNQIRPELSQYQNFTIDIIDTGGSDTVGLVAIGVCGVVFLREDCLAFPHAAGVDCFSREELKIFGVIIFIPFNEEDKIFLGSEVVQKIFLIISQPIVHSEV